jgi:hypothetical protein
MAETGKWYQIIELKYKMVVKTRPQTGGTRGSKLKEVKTTCDRQKITRLPRRLQNFSGSLTWTLLLPPPKITAKFVSLEPMV